MLVADWNLDLKENWVRALLRQHWGADYKLGWKHFPTAGTSLGGERVIDGALYRNMATEGSVLLPRSASTDHRPFKTVYALGKPEPQDFYDPATGKIGPGKEWWGFGDYRYDELFENKPKVDEDGNTIITFDFSKMDPSMY
jgi:hypothetical protein